jgi:uncharacterized cupin superfamily protein
MSRTLADATTVDLPDKLAAGTEVVAGQPRAATATLAALGGMEIGVWEMTAGTARDVEAEEVFVVVSGQGTVSFDDGEQIELRPGIVVRLRAGDRSTWLITHTLRKVYLSAA